MATTSTTAATSSALSSSTAAALASTPAAVAAANKAAAQKLISSLGAGSGVDVASLAQNLVDAEGTPQKNAINAKITKNEARISGYSAMSYVLSQVNTAMTALKDQNSFNALSAVNTNTSAFSVTTSASAAVGSHDVEVLRLAKAQRTVSGGFALPSISLNGGKAMSVSLYLGAKPTMTSVPGIAPVTENSAVTFKPLTAGQTVTVAGLTFTAGANGSTAAEVAAAFASLTSGASFTTSTMASTGSVQGTLTNFSSGAVSGNTITFTNATPSSNTSPDIVISTDGSAPTVSTQQGVTPTRQTATVSFTALLPGQSVSIAGLKYTATTATSASEVAAAFSGLAGGATSSTTAPKGTFTGTLTDFSASADMGTGSLIFTSSSTGVTPTLSMESASTPLQLTDGKDTPQDVVNAINNASLGIKAQLVNTGDGSSNPYQIILNGQAGAANVFSISTDYGLGTGSPGLNFASNGSNQTASDAVVKVDGISYTRNTNTLTDVVPGLTLNLKGLTNGTAASVDLTRDTTPIKDKITALVSAYNDAISIFGAVSDPKSTLDTYGATLVGDSTVRSVKQQLRGMFTGSSSTPGTTVNALWQLGISIDQTGAMSVDSTKLDTALTNNFDDVVKAFTGNQNGLSVYSTLPAGIAGDAVKKLTNLLGSNGALLAQSESANTQNTKYKDDLSKLQTRMDSLLKRYQKQFASMDSLVGTVNSQKTSLKSTFDGMMASLTGKSG